MNNYTIEEITVSTDRYKLYVLMCNPTSLTTHINSLQSLKVNVVNIGKELASFILNLGHNDYLNIEVHAFLTKLLDISKAKINGMGNDVVAIYNLGILLEPDLEINAVQLLKDYSKSTSLIIIWENQFELPNKLFWPTQKNTYLFDFTNTPLKELQYAV